MDSIPCPWEQNSLQDRVWEHCGGHLDYMSEEMTAVLPLSLVVILDESILLFGPNYFSSIQKEKKGREAGREGRKEKREERKGKKEKEERIEKRKEGMKEEEKIENEKKRKKKEEKKKHVWSFW